MWEKQIRAERALNVAYEAQMKAARAVRKAKMGLKKKPEDDYHSLASSGTLSGNAAHDSETHGEGTQTSSSSSSSDAESSHNEGRSPERASKERK